MDKSWIEITDRRRFEFRKGVDDFLAFAFANLKTENIRCPCLKCNNCNFKTLDGVRFDLYIHGIVPGYTRWIHHGEDTYELSTQSDDELDETNEGDDGMHDLIYDLFGNGNSDTRADGEFAEHTENLPNLDIDKLFGLLSDAKQELYPGCTKFSKLSFIVNLLHIKCRGGVSDKVFDWLLELLKNAFPDGNKLPKSLYEAKKIVRDLGLNYVKIDACENDCMLYWKEHVDAQQCHICGLSRWRSDNKISRKILRYFPLKSRLQRLFMSRETAEDMRWHKNERKNDGIMRHPSDSKAWKHFDEQHERFSLDPRNVRLGLASDGFNPFGSPNVSHSTWPVVLVPYNLPPWKCLKQPFFMMTLLIPGPKSPGNDIDVYLQPLIEELKELWEVGIETYDAFAKEKFQLHAAVLWTISDFPAYANLSGWSTKGKLACPCCNKETCHRSLASSGKQSFMGHRRFLPRNHIWRDDAKNFDKTVEDKDGPKNLSGDDILDQLEEFEPVVFGKVGLKRKHDESNNWRKKSIFFELPYWRTLLLRHNLDVMHIEKNICESVLGTVMNISGKTKDTIKARLDLIPMEIREELQPIDRGTYWEMPSACYTLNSTEKKDLCEFLKRVKFPDGYSSNISRCVTKEGKLLGMKSHDYHVFMQHLLPLAIRGRLPNEVCEALIEMSFFFKELCAKSLKIDVLEHLQKQIAKTLCKLEMIFPPAFFDVMVHLAIHVPDEALIAGPVQYRWMYQIERYLRTLKSYVRNKAHPEGSIAEGYLAEECLTFCSMYLDGVETRFNRPERNYEGDIGKEKPGLSIFAHNGRVVGKATDDCLLGKEYDQTRIYVLKNCEEVWPFIDKHKEEIERQSPINVEMRHEREFPAWFEKHVTTLYNDKGRGGHVISKQLLSLARGPDKRVARYKTCIINGFRFHTKDRDSQRKTQNSGVVVKGDDQAGNIDYYGVLADIVELQYIGENRIVLFNCDWWDVSRQGVGYKIDEYGFTTINVSRKLSTNEPFVLACQAEQVYYVQASKNLNWQTVIKNDPRNFYNMPNVGEEETPTPSEEPYQQSESSSRTFHTLDTNNSMASLKRRRTDVGVILVDPSLVTQEEGIANEEDEGLNEEGDHIGIDDNDNFDTMLFDD